MVPIQTYVIKPENIDAREEFAKKLITALEQGKKIINFDESGFNCSSNKNYGWVSKEGGGLRMHQKGFKNITLLSVITLEGDHFYSFVKGTHNQITMVEFLRQLTRRLDHQYPDWRETPKPYSLDGQLHYSQRGCHQSCDMKAWNYISVFWTSKFQGNTSGDCVLPHQEKSLSNISRGRREKVNEPVKK